MQATMTSVMPTAFVSQGYLVTRPDAVLEQDFGLGCHRALLSTWRRKRGKIQNSLGELGVSNPVWFKQKRREAYKELHKYM